jgi:ABC-type bacteriocin/lantibiotic exporter with double-glycine peptidase domain
MPYQSTLLLLSIYAGVSFRVIPSINRILAASLQIRSNEYVISELRNITNLHDQEFNDHHPRPSFEDSLELRALNTGYQPDTYILKDVSLKINKGERIIITGKSGAGKTTLLYVLLGFLKPAQGEILMDGKKISVKDPSWKTLIGYVPQSPYILDASISENIAFGVPMEMIDYHKIEQLVRDMGLTQWVNGLPQKLNTLIGEKGVKISGGQRQRIAIARVLYKEAEILLLDETTNQLDLQTEMEIMNIITQIASQKKTIIMISHRSQASSHFDSAYEMRDGHLEKLLTMSTESLHS